MIALLEEQEAELWFRYQELDQRTRELADSGNTVLHQRTKKDAVWAHRRHQKMADYILRLTRERLFAEVRVDHAVTERGE